MQMLVGPIVQLPNHVAVAAVLQLKMPWWQVHSITENDVHVRNYKGPTELLQILFFFSCLMKQLINACVLFLERAALVDGHKWFLQRKAATNVDLLVGNREEGSTCCATMKHD